MCSPQTLYIVSVLLIFTSTAAMMGVYYLEKDFSNGWFIGEPVLSASFKIFTVMYFVSYLGLIFRTFMKYSKTKVIVNFSNFKVVVTGALLFYPLAL